jgi:hypothetical protein
VIQDVIYSVCMKLAQSGDLDIPRERVRESKQRVSKQTLKALFYML